MAKNKQKDLRMFYSSLLQQQRVFDSIPSNVVEISSQSILPLEQELHRFNSEFPEMMPVFDKSDYYLFTASDSSGGRMIFNFRAIRSYLGMLIGRIEVAIEESSDTPIIEKNYFPLLTTQNSGALLKEIILKFKKAT